VTLGYGPENACPAGTFTLLIRYTLRRTGIGILPMIGRSRCHENAMAQSHRLSR